MKSGQYVQRRVETAGWQVTVSAMTLLGCTVLAITPAHAKLPGMVHCYNDICHRVRTVDETQARRGVVEAVVASFYDSPANDRFNPRLETSSGAMFDADTADNAASPIHPDGTVLLVWSPVTRGAAVVRVNNAGPYFPGRTLDVSRGVAEKIGFTKGGVMQLLSVVIAAPSDPEARYQRGRVYPRVRGYLGTFDNLALASLEDPAAREAVFQGNQPLPALALNATQHLVLAATEQHMKSQALAAEFAAVPADFVAPPELHSSMIEVDCEVVAPEVAIAAMLEGTTSEPPVIVVSDSRVITLSAAHAGGQFFASLPAAATFEDTVRVRILKAKAKAESEDVKPLAAVRPIRRQSNETATTRPSPVSRQRLDVDTPDGR